MTQASIDWALHAPMVFRILQDSEYLKRRDVEFTLSGSTIHRKGGWMYSPSKIESFNDALDVLRDNVGGVGLHFDAICILQGVSYHSILHEGKEFLRKLFN